MLLHCMKQCRAKLEAYLSDNLTTKRVAEDSDSNKQELHDRPANLHGQQSKVYQLPLTAVGGCDKFSRNAQLAAP